MEEIVALTIEDPFTRETLNRCDKTCLVQITEDEKSEIRKWALTSLHAVGNADLHKLGSEVIASSSTGDPSATKHKMQQLLDKSVADSALMCVVSTTMLRPADIEYY